MPWWNPFEGVGVPLAGEMQSAALFPLTWLLAFPNGQLIEHLTLQVIAGLSTWFLLRQLRLGRLPAFAGAAVFAFNGVFAWLANAVINPVPFLPMILLGIERAAAHPQRRWTGGGAWISVGIAASLYGGFPEVAYLNGLLAVAWVLARACVLAPDERWRFLTRVAAAGITGLLIAAPVLIAFADYLRVADLDTHAGMGFLSRHLEPGDLVVMALPWLYGGLFFDPGHRHFWGDVGGYGGCTLFILAFAGVFGRGRRGLRLVLAGWVVVALALTFGVPISPWLAYVIPGLKQIALYRYLPASWIMCLCVLAAFALDDVATADRAAPGRGRAIAAGLALLTVLLGCALLVPGATSPPFLVNAASRRTTALAALSLLGLAIMLTPRRIPRDRRVAGVAAILVGEALTWFILPTFYAPRGGTIDLDGVGFLRDHLGLQRFATLGPIAPNYGAWFGIAGINHNDLPMPSAWSAYVRDHLDRNATSTIFNGINREDPGGPSAVEELIANRAGYASSGVRYVVAAPDQTIPAPAGGVSRP